MEIFQKTHKQEFIEPEFGNSIGLTRNEIIKNLEPMSIFINNGLFFYTIDEEWSEITFNFMLNDKCISEIVYDCINKKIKFENTKANRFSKKLKENFNLHLDQLEQIETKERKDVKDN